MKRQECTLRTQGAVALSLVLCACAVTQQPQIRGYVTAVGPIFQETLELAPHQLSAIRKHPLPMMTQSVVSERMSYIQLMVLQEDLEGALEKTSILGERLTAALSAFYVNPSDDRDKILRLTTRGAMLLFADAVQTIAEVRVQAQVGNDYDAMLANIFFQYLDKESRAENWMRELELGGATTGSAIEHPVEGKRKGRKSKSSKPPADPMPIPSNASSTLFSLELTVKQQLFSMAQACLREMRLPENSRHLATTQMHDELKKAIADINSLKATITAAHAVVQVARENMPCKSLRSVVLTVTLENRGASEYPFAETGSIRLGGSRPIRYVIPGDGFWWTLDANSVDAVPMVLSLDEQSSAKYAQRFFCADGVFDPSRFSRSSIALTNLGDHIHINVVPGVVNALEEAPNLAKVEKLVTSSSSARKLRRYRKGAPRSPRAISRDKQ